MIEVQHVSKRFDNNLVLSDATVSFEEDRVYAILAPNGTGKTTFISILAGFMKQDSGEIILSGNTRKDDFNVILSGERNLYMKNTVYENLIYLCALRGMSEKEAKARIEAEKESFALYESVKDKLVESLSFGQKRLVALMSAIVSGAGCIVIDEATEGLDLKNREILSDIIRKTAKGRIIIIIAQDLDFAQKTADRVVFLKDGMFTKMMNSDDQNDIEQTYRELYNV